MREHIRYYRPQSVAEAVALLREHSGKSAIINGGTDVLIDVRSGKFTGDCLVDISRIQEIKGVREHDGAIIVGAGVTIEELATSRILQEKLPALALTGINFAGRQIRNVATIGGNVAHASPSGDTQTGLTVYDAVGLVASSEGERTIPVCEMFKGANKSALNDTDLLLHFIIRPCAAKYQHFEKIGRRKDLAISRASLAVLIDQDSDGTINFARVSLGACKPSTGRMPRTEDFLLGKNPRLSVFREAAKSMSAEMIAITGRRKSLAYKEPAIEGLLLRMLIPLL
ncbi:MAG: FAD binding domain-containing protein [Candidatus Adiutrix sp.]|jgi:CO/xanthine dehydrogenase FAD-binding subunit|nr:FAD binding domain-containing protein [Candidatus Adiutrix sp.]